MILKGSQRSGGQNLAVHLMRVDENEHVELHDMRGFISDDLHGAFKEAHAISRGTKCKQYLFSLSLNPPESEQVPVAAFEKAIAQIEDELGLSGQPRAIVFHEKQGRRHAHCVWSRIDADTMTAKPLSFFKKKLTAVSRKLYLEHDWKMPRGLENSENRDPRNFTLAVWQQAKRTGQDPRMIKGAIQDAWAVSDSLQSFEHALKDKGFWLARGDRRGFVAVDHTGEVYAIARALGRKAKDVRGRLGNEKALKSLTEVKQEIAAAMTPAMKAHIESARDRFKDRAAALSHQRSRMAGVHRDERDTLKFEHEIRREKESKVRAARLPRGLKGLWSRVTGHHKRIHKANARDADQCAKRDANEKDALIARHLGERYALQSEIKTSRKAQAVLLQELRCDVRRFVQMGREPDPPDQNRKRRRTRTPRE